MRRILTVLTMSLLWNAAGAQTAAAGGDGLTGPVKEVRHETSDSAPGGGAARRGRSDSYDVKGNKVEERHFGPDLSARVPLFTKNPGFATLNFRGGYRLGEHTRLTFILENVLDKNYRTMGSGTDAPGTNAVVSFSRTF